MPAFAAIWPSVTVSRSSKTPVRRTSRRRAGRPVGTFGVARRVQFLSDEEPRRARRRRRRHHERRGSSPDKLRRLRNGGQAGKYQHVEFGVNSRLDEMQAAILRARLARLPAWTDAPARARRARTAAALAGARVDGAARMRSGPRLSPVSDPDAPTATAFQAHLAARGIGTLVHYPVADPAPAGARASHERAVSRSPSASRVRSARCRSIHISAGKTRRSWLRRSTLGHRRNRPAPGVPARGRALPRRRRRTFLARATPRRRTLLLGGVPQRRLVGRRRDGARGGRRVPSRSRAVDQRRRRGRRSRSRARPPVVPRRGPTTVDRIAAAVRDRRARRLAVLPHVRVRDGRQGSRRLRERGRPDRARAAASSSTTPRSRACRRSHAICSSRSATRNSPTTSGSWVS